MAVKLRPLTTAKGFTPQELEAHNFNLWLIEQALNSVGATTPTVIDPPPGSTISHHSLLDLASGNDHPQYLTLDTPQTVKNKTIDTTNNITIKDVLMLLVAGGDITKKLGFDLSGIPTATQVGLLIEAIDGINWTLSKDGGILVSRNAVDSKTGQTTSIGAVTLIASTKQAGIFRLNGYIVATAVTAPGTIQLRGTWTDPHSTKTNQLLWGTDPTAGVFSTNPSINVAGDYSNFYSMPFFATASSVIKYDTVLGFTGTYNCYVRLEALV